MRADRPLRLSRYGWVIHYANRCAGVEVEFEQFSLHVHLVKLVDGSFPPYPIFVRDDTEIFFFNLQDLLTLDGLSWFEDGLEEKSDTVVASASAALRQSGHRMLRCDFSQADALGELVRGRAQRLRHS